MFEIFSTGTVLPSYDSQSRVMRPDYLDQTKMFVNIALGFTAFFVLIEEVLRRLGFDERVGGDLTFEHVQALVGRRLELHVQDPGLEHFGALARRLVRQLRDVRRVPRLGRRRGCHLRVVSRKVDFREICKKIDFCKFVRFRNRLVCSQSVATARLLICQNPPRVITCRYKTFIVVTTRSVSTEPSEVQFPLVREKIECNFLADENLSS